VIQEVAADAGASGAGGLGTSTLAYFTNPDFPTSGSPDFNTWLVRTTETLPDGNENIVYTNINKVRLLEINVDNVDPGNPDNVGKAWITGYQYDSFGRLTSTIDTSAFDSSFYDLSDPAGYEQYADVGITEGGVFANSGLINSTTYY